MAEAGDGAARAAETLIEEMPARADFRDFGADALPDMDAAYDAQTRVAGALGPKAGGIGGRKIAFNTPEQMQAMGLSEPCAAVVFKDLIRESPARFSEGDFATFTVEPEIAAILCEDMAPRYGGWDAESAHAAVGRFVPAFEILDRRRFEGGRPEAIVAANVFNAGAVLGGPGKAPGEVDFSEIRSVVEADGETKVDKVDAAPMDPFAAVAFLANRFNRLGQTPRAGEVMLLGAHLPPTPVSAPARWRFALGPLGEVEFEIA
ncbi:MAG TPA: hypothetical protein VJ994_04350 [Paracoccaceae bacterium]|nr:hypothetical protein [Paracoccaceae bacterium]